MTDRKNTRGRSISLPIELDEQIEIDAKRKFMSVSGFIREIYMDWKKRGGEEL